MLIENLDLNKYKLTEVSVEPKRAVMLSYLIVFIGIVLYTAVYLLRYDYANIFFTMFKPTFLLEFFILMLFAFLFMAAGLIVKGAVLASSCGNKWQSLKFKIVRRLEKPYCSAVEPVSVSNYIKSILAYILIASIVPYIIAFFVGDFMFIIASYITLILVSGDILLLFKLLKTDGSDYILDIDCVIYYKIYSAHKH